MAVIGVIIVYQWDGCNAVKVVHTETEFDALGSWFIGFEQCFCDACSLKVEHQAAIEREEETARAFSIRASALIPHKRQEAMHAG